MVFRAPNRSIESLYLGFNGYGLLDPILQEKGL